MRRVARSWAWTTFPQERRSSWKGHTATGRFQFHQTDLLSGRLKEHLGGVDVVFHFAANPDVRQGPNNTRVHMEQNIEATYLVLEAMRAASVRSICFPSTSTVYGEPGQIPTEEGYGPLIPISIYGASKLACEALICSYAHTFDMDAAIYRFANVVGSRSTHNVLHDFIRKLREEPQAPGDPWGGARDQQIIRACLRLHRGHDGRR